MSSQSLLQGIFPTQGSNPGLSHCSWILYGWTTGEAGFCCHYLFFINMQKTTASRVELLIPHVCHHGGLDFYVQLNISYQYDQQSLSVSRVCPYWSPLTIVSSDSCFSLLGWDSPLRLFSYKEGRGTGQVMHRSIRPPAKTGGWGTAGGSEAPTPAPRCPLPRRQLPLAAGACLEPAPTGTFFGPFQSAVKHSRTLSSAWAFSTALAGFPGISQVPAPPGVCSAPLSSPASQFPS